ncbi:putative membrane protein [Rhodoblastus acidophilus]|uniref:hypothetical protein n=1 Tax=Rhodoblastus acidophilus TaxID=1074 RepID=UPI0022258817|nr:hypothetical protein [Rhodoblastus acidophilus]MCW2284074.1 putative membrane protein [Rhodoblastus acidophilus]MCW2332770.1 putative membrane protein [Rhodoblastus acidophilus]
MTAAVLTAVPATAEQDEAHRAAKAKAADPNCALEQQTCVPKLPQPAPLNEKTAKADAPKTQWIFQEPPQNTLPFQNDLSPVKKKPVGGLVGLEIPF